MKVVTKRTTVAPKSMIVRRASLNGSAREHAPRIRRTRVDGQFLKRTLMVLDGAAIGTAWSIAFIATGGAANLDIAVSVGVVAAIVAASIFFARTQKLYLARACAVRAEEKARLLRVTPFATVVAVMLGAIADVTLTWQDVVVGAGLTFLLLATCRAAFRHWLTIERVHGHFLRPVVVVGDNDEARDVIDLTHYQPELGLRVVGYVGLPPGLDEPELPAPWLGDAANAVRAVEQSGATGVIVIATAHSAAALNRLVHEMLSRHVHVQLSTGLHGVTHRRLRPAPLSHEPLFYVEPGVPSRFTLVLKRVGDIVLATLLGIITLPVVAVAGIAIKLTDRGPVLFRQERIGRFGEPFTCYKLRTMRPGSEAHLEALAERNMRVDSPLFKDPFDPRRTRVGRVLEAMSIDELPQLWNVLRGDMSLVGPRPALAHEVAQFDEELLARHNVRPGITGLWQVESRDNPDFRPYRRLDLVYVENLSFSLDLAILSMTAQLVVVRALQQLVFRHGDHADTIPAQTIEAR